MDFVAVMDQVIALLRQRSRLTYRTLQLQFQLDETQLEVLKDELILHTRLAQERGVHLAVRLGIHTGLVVVGEVGDGSRQEQLALGETPNLAARLQGIAAPNTLVISAATLQLLGGLFAYQTIGTPLLKGIAQPRASALIMRGWAIAVQEHSPEGRPSSGHEMGTMRDKGFSGWRHVGGGQKLGIGDE
jgi:hypothetical protein